MAWGQNLLRSCMSLLALLLGVHLIFLLSMGSTDAAILKGAKAGFGRFGGYGGYGHGHKKYHHYNPCGRIYAAHGFCKHKYAGHYGHHNKKCYVQCDDWGRGFVRPCAKGTYWAGGKGPTKYNKCIGRHHRYHGNRGYRGGYGGYGGYRGGYGSFGFGGY